MLHFLMIPFLKGDDQNALGRGTAFAHVPYAPISEKASEILTLTTLGQINSRSMWYLLPSIRSSYYATGYSLLTSFGQRRSVKLER